VFFLGAATLLVAVVALIGVGHEESFELLLTWSFTFYGIAYLGLFAIPVLARKDSGLRGAVSLKAAAIPGFLVTLLFVVLSVFPIINVVNSWKYSMKIAGVVVGANLLGYLIYRTNPRKEPGFR